MLLPERAAMDVSQYIVKSLYRSVDQMAEAVDEVGT
jgi:hypothetical protein